MQINNYEKFLESINEDLRKIFEYKKEYIYCKKGCSYCCERGDYPISELEFKYLMLGYEKLEPDIKEEIKKNIKKLKNGNKESYVCPFLINNECSVYAYRGIICRSFGLIYTVAGEAKPKIPFCVYKGLNYSNVFDTETGMIPTEKYKALNIDKEPLAYNVSYNFLTSEDFEKMFKFKFGDKKPLIDWF